MTTADTPEVESSRAAISAGNLDSSGTFPYVVRLGHPVSSCSGVLITPGLVLTANHCLRGDHICGLPYSETDLGVDDWTVELGANPTDPELSPGHTYSRVIRGITVTQPMSELLGHSIDNCNKDDPSMDLALLRLDRRVPLSAVTPMHVPLNGYPSCAQLGSFPGTQIGYGDCNPWNQASTNCPTFGERHWANIGGWERITDRPGFPLPPPPAPPVYTNLPGATYTTYWSPPEFLAYTGTLFGDSGGPLVSQQSFSNLLPGQQPGMVGNAGGRILCGVASRFYRATQYDLYPFPNEENVPVADDDPSVDSAAALAWLAQNVIASDGTFIGECFSGPTQVRDQDSDDDLIPDACDPCPQYFDPNYDLSRTPDTDGDGVPDRCDNCPTASNVPTVRQLPDAGWVYDQLDTDQDGYGDVCDTCGKTNLVNPPPPTVFTDYACCQTDSDCGVVPSCNPGNPEEPIPPHQMCFPGDSRGNLLEALIDAGVTPCANHCDRPVDFDCDNKGDLCDLCPGVFNPGQQDTDGDGVGDACDNCPGHAGDPQTADLNPTCSYFDPTGLGADFYCANFFNPNSVCLPPHPKGAPSASDVSRCTLFADPEHDGVGEACDNCRLVSNAAQKNCNRDQEIVSSVPYPYVGDACDRNPCTAFSVYNATQTEQELADRGWVEQISYYPRLLPPGRTAEYYGPAFSIDAPPPRATTGLRFCSCDELDENGLPDPVKCHVLAGCTMNTNQYNANLAWRTPSMWPTLVTNNPPIYDMPGAERADQPMIDPVPGDSYVGLAPEASAATDTAYWYTAPDIAAFGGGKSQLVGVLWSHVTNVTRLLPNASAAASVYSPWSNHFQGGVFGPPPRRTWVLPPYLAIDPEIMIDPCPWHIRDVPVWLVEPSGAWVAVRSTAGDFDVTAKVTPAARRALAAPSMRWAAPSETAGELTPLAPRLASVSSDGLRVTALIASQAGQVVERLQLTSGATATPGRADFGLALAANDASVFIVGGRDLATGTMPGDAWRFDAASLSWTHLPLFGVLPRVVLAMTYRAKEAALYVVDESDLVRGSLQARLLRIDLSTRRSTLLGQWTRHVERDRIFLSNTEDGALLLVGSSTRLATYVGVSFDPAGALTQAFPLSFVGTGAVAVRPTLTSNGLTVPLTSGGLTNVFTPMSTLLARPGNQLIAECL